MTESNARFVAVHTLNNRFEADLLLDALEKEGISALLRSFEETAFDGLFVSQKGWGRILVPEESRVAAEDVIRSLLAEVEEKPLFTDPDGVDPELWERLAAADPDEIGRCALVSYDRSIEAYYIPFLNGEFFCHPGKRLIERAGFGSFTRVDFEFTLVLLHYLLDARPVSLTGRWIGEKEIPGGETFFRGPHSFPLDRLAKSVATTSRDFEATAGRLGGLRAAMGDLSYRLIPLPRVPLLFVYWEGDDEFEASMNVRFDASVIEQLPRLDLIWALVNVVCRSFEAAGASRREGDAP